MNLYPFYKLLIDILSLYKFALGVWIILSWLVTFNIVNRNQLLVRRIGQSLNKIIEPVLTQIRRYTPSIGGVDLSSIILFLLINFIQNFIITYLL